MSTPPPAWQGRVPAGLPLGEGRLPQRWSDPAVFLWAPPQHWAFLLCCGFRAQSGVPRPGEDRVVLVQTGEPRREMAYMSAGLFLLQINHSFVLHREAKSRDVISNFQKVFTVVRTWRTCPRQLSPVLRMMPPWSQTWPEQWGQRNEEDVGVRVTKHASLNEKIVFPPKCKFVAQASGFSLHTTNREALGRRAASLFRSPPTPYPPAVAAHFRVKGLLSCIEPACMAGKHKSCRKKFQPTRHVGQPCKPPGNHR